MKLKTGFHILCVVLVFSLISCAGGKQTAGGGGGGFFGAGLFSGGSSDKDTLFEDPPEKILFSDKEVFKEALALHKKGQVLPAMQLWKDFLKQQPKSFEALNNLGMSYYSNDNLDEAVRSFEAALQLEPSSEKIKNNLMRTLRFRATLSRENKQHHKAVGDLQRMMALTASGKKEKLLKEVEQEQDAIYQEVERRDTLDAYENFVREFPNSIFAEKARQKIGKRAPTASRKEFERGPGSFLPSGERQAAEPQSLAGAVPPPQVEGDLDDGITRQGGFSEPLSFSEPMGGPGMESPGVPEPMPDMGMGAGEEDVFATLPPESPPAVEESFPGEDDFASVMPSTGSLEENPQQVKITTRTSPLNVRKGPSLKAAIIGKVDKGTVHDLLGEIGDWFHIAYPDANTTGWISKKYSQIVE
ncbi:MAG: SH3 domain-containing protein [Nitrospinales bacterium]